MAPSRDEVDDFLRAQDLRVRQAIEVSERSRQSILTRLRAAVGKVRPDGATFHAWRNVFAATMAQARRRVLTVGAIGGIALSAAACTPAAQDAPAPGPSVPTSAASPLSPAPGVTVEVAPAHFSGEAVDAFGADRVQAGYQEMAAYTGALAFSDERIQPKDRYTAADFADAREGMTEHARAAWDEQVARIVAGDISDDGGVKAITYYDVGGTGWSFAPDGPRFSGQRIDNPQVAVDRSTGQQRLAMTVEHHGDLYMLQDGLPVSVGVDKSVTYVLVPSTDGKRTWLIDDWQGSYTASNPVPVPA